MAADGVRSAPQRVVVKPRRGLRAVMASVGESGFTLTELIVVSMLMVVVLGGVYSLFGAGQSFYARVEAQNAAVGAAVPAMYHMTKEVREAVSIQSNLPGYGAFTPDGYQVCLSTDYDNDGELENVAFRVDGSQRLIKYINQTNSSSYSSQVLANYVRNRTLSIPVFTYYDTSGTAMSDVTKIPGRTYSMKVELAVDYQSTRPPPPLRLVTTVARRNRPSG